MHVCLYGSHTPLSHELVKDPTKLKLCGAGPAGGRAVPSQPEAAGNGPEGQARQEQHHLPRCHVLRHVPPGL